MAKISSAIILNELQGVVVMHVLEKEVWDQNCFLTDNISFEAV